MTETPILVGLNDAAGRMGSRLVQLIAEAPDLVLAVALDREDHPALGQDAGTLAGRAPLGVPLCTGWTGPLDVMIDFSTPEASLALLRHCLSQRTPLVVGTTGFDATQRKDLEAAAHNIPLFVASNYSKAVNLLVELTRTAARVLGDSADIEVVERHHHFKMDAPSGTALTLAEAAAAAAATGTRQFVHGRHGQVGQRPRGEIGLHALRIGDNPGEHTVVFGLMGECLELSHRALNRDGFCRGALDAARFLATRPAGFYGMKDMLAGLID